MAGLRPSCEKVHLSGGQDSGTVVMKGLGMSSRVYVTGHIKYHMPCIEKSR